MTNLQSLEFFIPELILTITILAALITDLFVKKSKTNMIGWVLGVGLVVVGLSIYNLSSVPPTTLFLDMIGSWVVFEFLIIFFGSEVF